MLGVFRQFGVSQAIRTSVPRSLSSRWAPQLSKLQPLAIRTPALGRSFQTSFPALKAAAGPVPTRIDEEELITKFADLRNNDLIDEMIVRNITHPARMGLETMTAVQSETIHQMLKGDDILAQAKTGTGKTLAFLLPTMQNIMNDPTLTLKADGPAHRRGPRASSSDIRALIISPTRELAEQIAAEARKMTPGTGLLVQTAVGGTQKRAGLQKIQREGCHLLVGTPGRIKDILSDPYSGVTTPQLNTLILDEADRLLDQGFSEEINEISALLPDPLQVPRQTLMFSATVPKEVLKMVNRTMKPDYKYVKTVRDDEVPVHLKVPQKFVIQPGYENALPGVLELAQVYQARQQEDPELRPFKAIVYFNSTSETQLAAEAFQNLPRGSREDPSNAPLGRMRFLEIHSRLSQRQRTYAADAFRRAPEAILFSSDVTARGMDFPDVTHVIQIGVPNDRETYIHRTGRTARAGKTGEGWVFIHANQIDNLSDKCHGMPVTQDRQTLQTSSVDMSKSIDDAPEAARNTIELINNAMTKVSGDLKFHTYRAQLGSTLQTFNSKRTAINVLNRLAVHGYRLAEPPALSSALVKNLGLRNIPEVRVDDTRRPSSGDDNRRPGGFGGDRDRRSPRAFGGDRGSRSFGGDRGSRSFGDRERSPRSYGGDRGDRGSRSFGDRERSPRSFGGDRERSSRSRLFD
ncbi:ATP-dependent RNA helicase [Penicillium odoratum]|uniref:ATP-dependent RNA helicase n=1 Tax=Penicillium odoratum TaxID=1167516 RepID=UPI0025486EDB|nr:ATP-dependent RNA helicase [Penicillium odoratum]KAJ5764951.1 ATP-dependent RNA helicase [Penicillium odoratum]